VKTVIVRPRAAAAALTAGAACTAAWWWPRRILRHALTQAELARITDRAAHQQTAAVLSTVLAEASARMCEDLVLSDATEVIARAQAREE
jgi:hypothetical protein